VDVTQDTADEFDDVVYPAAASDPDAGLVTSTTTADRGLTLPSCDLSRLTEIAELFVATVASTPIRRDRLATAVEHDGYVRQLVDVFRRCEDLEDADGLRQLYTIFRCLFLLNKPSLLDVMLSTDLILDVVGALEYDPTSPEPQAHREFLTSGSQLRQVSNQS